jgi:hypothetical protein
MMLSLNEHYENLIKLFLAKVNEEKIEKADLERIPVIHIPIIGKYYQKDYLDSNYKNIKIAIYGKETNYWYWKNYKKKYWKNMATLNKKFAISPNDAYVYLTEEFKDSNIIDLRHDDGASFFDYVFHFIKRLYKLDDIGADLRTMKERYPEIVQSFIWGNINSFEESGNKYKINKKTWELIKKHSKIFDETLPNSNIFAPSNYILEEYKPNILLILYRNFDFEKWLSLYGMEKQKSNEYFSYAYFKKILIIKHIHPTEMTSKNKKITYKESLDLLIGFLKKEYMI